MLLKIGTSGVPFIFLFLSLYICACAGQEDDGFLSSLNAYGEDLGVGTNSYWYYQQKNGVASPGGCRNPPPGTGQNTSETTRDYIHRVYGPSYAWAFGLMPQVSGGGY